MKCHLLIALATCLFGVTIAGCSHNNAAPVSASSNSASNSIAAPANDHDAVVAAIQKHLSSDSGINMSVMNMTVNTVNVNGDQAQADAEFHLKQGGTSMNITYKLERHAGDWIVLSDAPSGGQFAHPPMDKNHSGGAASLNSSEPLPSATSFLKNYPARSASN